ncbi:hypothetical protein DRO61_07930 [Candidatus Bathyarchaeota archaeon]|jgi:hypothetical protein|nr:MAG: hypothetical protein DRO61_07930 [Candidatus Bathyarchaeota archaeon]
MLSENFFTVKVTAINPHYDYQGNEYVRIEFGYRPPKIPTMVPTSIPKEVSEALEASRNMVQVMIPPQVRAQMRKYTNRLTLYLTINEWENLQQKHTVGDEFKVILKINGSIDLVKK